MVQSYRPKEFSKKNNKKKTFEKSEGTSQGSKDYLDLWSVNPSFKDFNIRRTIAKILSFLILTFMFIISVYMSTENLITSVIIGFIFIVLFICVFHEGIFYLNLQFSNKFQKMCVIDPFTPYIFWFNNNEKETLFVHNKSDLISFAMQIYSIEMIPENVNPYIGGFIRSLSIKDIRLSYSYQVIQKPIINLSENHNISQETNNNFTSTIGKIYFIVFGRINGILTSNKVEKLHQFINLYSKYLKSNIVTNFHHFQTRLLTDEELLNAIRVLYTGLGTQKDKNSNEYSIRNSLKINYPKLAFFLFLLIYSEWFLSDVLILDTLYIVLIVLLLTLFLIFVWWRSILFEISRRSLMKNIEIELLNPFENVKFYILKKLPYSLFMHVDNRLLIGIKMVNLKYIYNNFYFKGDTKLDLRLERFIEAINYEKIHFTYTLKNESLFYHTFYHNGLDDVYEYKQRFILKNIENNIQEENWLSYRKGMWYSFLTLSVNQYELIDSLEITTFETLERKLDNKIKTLKAAFQSNFGNYKVEDLRSNLLISGYLFSVFKHNKFRIDGSHLSYLMLQGTTLIPLSTPVHILRRAIESKLPAEFNTPTHLRNFITIGHTINTEVFEIEIPFGFLYDQIRNLLIVNGISQNRQLTAMKIVSELIQQGKASLIFDFTGQWAKILSFFEGSQFSDDILHFRLGSAFTIDPLISDIPYDTHNTEYIEYMLDAFALAFKKEQRTINMFRNIISSNPKMELSSMQLEVQTQNEWQKTPLSYSLQDLFSDLTPHDRTYFQSLQDSNKIHAYDFIHSEKTVIVDLSVLKDLNKKLFFTFLILSKIIHYIKFKEDYYPKIIVIPYIDLFFEQRFLDSRMNYGKINSFLDPLMQRNFGLLFSANQVNYLHPNIYTYFSNIISFKATDNKDVSIIKSLLSLHETPGMGEYSNKRNRKYQLEYLKALTDNNALIKRDDIYQTFPAVIDWLELKNVNPFTYDQIITFMATKGYDLQSNERKIMEKARKTIFEKDFGQYYYYIDEIINFLKNISVVDGVANLYKTKVKKELKKILYPKLLQRTNKKEQMKKIRDEIFKILLKHEYLVEDHSRTASGSESLATSYKVGNQYKEALDDYFSSRGEKPEVKLEEVKEDFFPSQTRKYIIQQDNLIEALAREFSDFNYDIFKIYNFIENRQYSTALKIEQIIIKKFLFNVYRQYYNIDRAVMPSEVVPFFNLLEEIEDFPFTAEQLKDYVNQYQNINLDIDNPKKIAVGAYESLYNFFIKIQNYIYRRE